MKVIALLCKILDKFCRVYFSPSTKKNEYMHMDMFYDFGL